jgi:hypothetical protein
MSEMTAIERLIELEAIYRLKARRDHAVDKKDWVTYAALHSDDFVAMSIGDTKLIGGRACADALAVRMAGITSSHHSHTPVIEFEGRDRAKGVWSMEANLFWKRKGEKQWLHGFGFYHESYQRGADGEWRFTYRRLERTHAETSPGATLIAADISGENLILGVS